MMILEKPTIQAEPAGMNGTGYADVARTKKARGVKDKMGLYQAARHQSSIINGEPSNINENQGSQVGNGNCVV